MINTINEYGIMKMAKILYGVAGEGMGHATRSRVIIEHLLGKHEVYIASSRKPRELLSRHFKNVHDIHGPYLSYKNNRVQSIKTVFLNAYKLPKGSYYTFKKLRRIVKEFKPDIIISDFEPFTNIISKFFRIPLISIDNMHIMVKCKIKVPKRHYRDYLAAKIVIRSFVGKADYYMVNTFYYPKIKKRNTFLFPPVMREEILKAKTKNKGHILVYQTSKSHKKLEKILRDIDEKFILYGWGVNKKEGNIVFKKFNERKFVDDLASCKAMIANGGFGTIAEGIYLGKPVLSIPIRRHFEQILNALFVERLKYGEYNGRLNIDRVRNFISNIDVYKENLKKYRREGNSKILKKLDSVIGKIK